MRKALYLIFALAVVGGYAWADFNGYEMTTAKRGRVEQGMRGRSGGSRSFWYSGYRGGK